MEALETRNNNLDDAAAQERRAAIKTLLRLATVDGKTVDPSSKTRSTKPTRPFMPNMSHSSRNYGLKYPR
jgi:hypothetical protein